VAQPGRQAATSRLHRALHPDPRFKAAGWIHEIKHDGYRLIVRKQGDRGRLFTRRGNDWTDRYPLIRKAVAAIRTASVTIDGEAVCCDGAGAAVFEKLHSRAHDDQAFLYAFDLLELDGEDWRARPLETRKKRLAKLLAKAPAGIQYSEHLEGDGAAISPRMASPMLEDHLQIVERSGWGPERSWVSRDV
jgi:ATP-dependent DNA ligase